MSSARSPLIFLVAYLRVICHSSLFSQSVYAGHRQVLNGLFFLISGDEVLQWNGKALPGATKKEVYNIILESQSAPQVEIVVSRPIG